jgi:hypothetical protein
MCKFSGKRIKVNSPTDLIFISHVLSGNDGKRENPAPKRI